MEISVFRVKNRATFRLLMVIFFTLLGFGATQGTTQAGTPVKFNVCIIILIIITFGEIHILMKLL